MDDFSGVRPIAGSRSNRTRKSGAGRSPACGRASHDRPSAIASPHSWASIGAAARTANCVDYGTSRGACCTRLVTIAIRDGTHSEAQALPDADRLPCGHGKSAAMGISSSAGSSNCCGTSASSRRCASFPTIRHDADNNDADADRRRDQDQLYDLECPARDHHAGSCIDALGESSVVYA